jgi:hypothetical protein
MSIRARLVVLLAVVAAALGGSQRSPADVVLEMGGANNIVRAVATGTNMTAVHAHTQVASVGGITVGSTNIADAEATDCTGCHSTAVAVQTIFVVGSPQFYTPGNFAGAFNGGCNFCFTFAYAWQYLLQVSGPVHLTPTGQAELGNLRQQIADTAATPVNSKDDATALCLRLNDLTSQLRSVIDDELVASGVLATGTPNEHVDVSNGDLNENPCP